MISVISLKNSGNKTKKYEMIFDVDGKVKKISFGAKNYSDYTIHHDNDRKQKYIARHEKKEDWTQPMKAGTLSRFILWNKKTIQESLDDYMKRFNLKFKVTHLEKGQLP
jgi:hypothetical protein